MPNYGRPEYVPDDSLIDPFVKEKGLDGQYVTKDPPPAEAPNKPIEVGDPHASVLRKEALESEQDKYRPLNKFDPNLALVESQSITISLAEVVKTLEAAKSPDRTPDLGQGR